MNLLFQPYQESDKESLWITYVTAMKPHISEMWGWDTAWQEEDFRKGLTCYDTFILQDHSQRIGYIQVEHQSDSTFIGMIILEPQCQSKGYGPKVLDMVQSTQPAKPLTLRCFQVNKRAYAFYVRCGFEVIDMDNYFISMQRNTSVLLTCQEHDGNTNLF